MKDCIVKGTITWARKVGSALADVGKEFANPVEALKQVYDDDVYPVIHGKVTKKTLTTSGGFDMGTTVFTSMDGKQTVSIVNQNENLIAWDSLRNTPLVMAPDLICNVLPDGTGLSNYDLKVGQEVYVIGLKADPMLREAFYMPAFINGLQGVGYYGCYVPVEDLFG